MRGAPEAHPDLTAAERSLLHLLHAGLKDEAIARQLGISERTLRRRVTDLLTRLGADQSLPGRRSGDPPGWL